MEIGRAVNRENVTVKRKSCMKCFEIVCKTYGGVSNADDRNSRK